MGFPDLRARCKYGTSPSANANVAMIWHVELNIFNRFELKDPFFEVKEIGEKSTNMYDENCEQGLKTEESSWLLRKWSWRKRAT